MAADSSRWGVRRRAEHSFSARSAPSRLSVDASFAARPHVVLSSPKQRLFSPPVPAQASPPADGDAIARLEERMAMGEERLENLLREGLGAIRAEVAALRTSAPSSADKPEPVPADMRAGHRRCGVAVALPSLPSRRPSLNEVSFSCAERSCGHSEASMHASMAIAAPEGSVPARRRLHTRGPNDSFRGASQSASQLGSQPASQSASQPASQSAEEEEEMWALVENDEEIKIVLKDVRTRMEDYAARIDKKVQKDGGVPQVADIHAQGHLHLLLIKGSALIAADANGLSDPYVKLHLCGASHKSRTIKRSLNPVWHERFAFRGVLSELTREKLRLSVYDRDLIGSDDAMGAAEVDLGGHVYFDEMRRDMSIALDTQGTITLQVGPCLPISPQELAKISRDLPITPHLP